MDIRRLTTIEEFREVQRLEERVWGYTTGDDAVPAQMLLVSSHVGGLVIGAHAHGRMIGFAYSMPAVRDGKPYQWSHMLGVDPEYRNAGVGWRLKIEQRRMVMEAGLDLIAWTFDPLQAANAHVNFRKLGAIAREYREDEYPGSSSGLHAGTPTDRLVVEWWLRSERLASRLDRAAGGETPTSGGRAPAPGSAPAVNRVRQGKRFLEPAGHDLSIEAPWLAVVIPTGFSEMQVEAVPLALEWRLATREMFEALLARGYTVGDFARDRAARRGTYLLARESEVRPRSL